MKLSTPVHVACALPLLILANTPAPILGQDVAVDADAMESGARSAFGEDLKDCGSAVLDLAMMLKDDSTCPMVFDTVFSFLSMFDVPSVDFSGSGMPSIDFGIPDTLPEVTELCKDAVCMTKLTAGLANIDEKCAADDLKLLPDDAAYAIKAVRAFVEGLCVTDDNGNFCLQSIADILVTEAGKLFDDDASNNRDILCSECSINAQKHLLSVLRVPETFHSLLQLTCLKDRSDGSYCPGADVMRGIAYAAQPKLYSSFFDKNELCESCQTQAIALSTPFLSGEHQEECHLPSGEASSSDDTRSVWFSFSDMNIGDKNVGDVITALKDDLATAFHKVEEYVDVIFHGKTDDGEASFEAVVTDEIDMPTEEDMREAVENSPLSHANSVADVTIDPTKPLEVSTSSDDGDTTSSTSFVSPRSVAPLAILASALLFGAA